MNLPRIPPRVAGALAALYLAALPCVAVAADDVAELGDSYRADALAPVPDEPPLAVQVLREDGAEPWPLGAREWLEGRIRNEWHAGEEYGPVYSSVGLWLRYPLVTADIGGRVLVPVLESARLPVAGTLVPQQPAGARRVVILFDASDDAALPVRAESDPGSARELPLLDVELDAIEHLLSQPSGDGLELGVIGFGAGTWPLVEIGDSAPAALRALADFRQRHPRGTGRSDAVCALWTSYDWLVGTPPGVEREVVLLTGASVPYSGRFLRCSGLPGDDDATCRRAERVSDCPATHEFTRLDGFSDLAQVASFARQVRGALVVTPVLFGDDRDERLYAEVARRSGGSVVRVSSASSLQALLPALVTRRVRAVVARNRSTGARSSDLLGADGRSVSGELALAPGPNDVELSVLGDRGVAALFRFRVYSLPDGLAGHLSAPAAPAAD